MIQRASAEVRRRRRRAEARARGRAADRAGRAMSERAGKRSSRMRAFASDAISTSMRRRRCSAKGRWTQRSCSSGSSPAIRRTSPAVHSSVPQGPYSNSALEDAGIDRSTVYVTNAVKHFKFILRGKRRIHNKPDAGEITPCRWWLEQERELIKPQLTVALGATAARSLVGKVVTISKVRDAPLTLGDGGECWVTVHPVLSFECRTTRPDARRARCSCATSSASRRGRRSCPARTDIRP